MPVPCIPMIVEYLAERPLGASTREIAHHFDRTEENAHASLRLMESRGQVLKGTGDRLDAPWTLVNTKTTPPIFNAMTTLSAMQELMRENHDTNR